MFETGWRNQIVPEEDKYYEVTRKAQQQEESLVSEIPYKPDQVWANGDAEHIGQAAVSNTLTGFCVPGHGQDKAAD